MPKIRFTADLDPELYEWVMAQQESRNEVLKQAVRAFKEQTENEKTNNRPD